jgi:hypothetical protein
VTPHWDLLSTFGGLHIPEYLVVWYSCHCVGPLLNLALGISNHVRTVFNPYQWVWFPSDGRHLILLIGCAKFKCWFALINKLNKNPILKI